METPILNSAASAGLLSFQVDVKAFYPAHGWEDVARGSTVSWLREAAQEALDTGASIVSFVAPWGELERIGSTYDVVVPEVRRFVSVESVQENEPRYYEFLGWVCRDSITGEIVGDTIRPSAIAEDVEDEDWFWSTWNAVQERGDYGPR